VEINSILVLLKFLTIYVEFYAIQILRFTKLVNVKNKEFSKAEAANKLISFVFSPDCSDYP